MFNDDDRVFAREAEKKLASLRCFLIGHAGGRFVNEEELGILRKQHSNLKPLLLAMGKRASLPRPGP